jgi:hypothetical protein
MHAMTFNCNCNASRKFFLHVTPVENLMLSMLQVPLNDQAYLNL